MYFKKWKLSTALLAGVCAPIVASALTEIIAIISIFITSQLFDKATMKHVMFETLGMAVGVNFFVVIVAVPIMLILGTILSYLLDRLGLNYRSVFIIVSLAIVAPMQILSFGKIMWAYLIILGSLNGAMYHALIYGLKTIKSK